MNVRRFDELDDIVMDDIPDLGADVPPVTGDAKSTSRPAPGIIVDGDGGRDGDEDEESIASDAYSVDFEEDYAEETEPYTPFPSASSAAQADLLRMSSSGDNQPSVSLATPAESRIDALGASNRYANVNLDDTSNSGTSPASSIPTAPLPPSSSSSMPPIAPQQTTTAVEIGTTGARLWATKSVSELNIGLAGKENKKSATTNIHRADTNNAPQEQLQRASAVVGESAKEIMQPSSSGQKYVVNAKKPDVCARQLGANRAMYSKVSYSNPSAKFPSAAEAVPHRAPVRGRAAGTAGAVGGEAVDARVVEKVVRRVLQEERTREKETEAYFSEKARKSKPISYLRMGIYDEQRRAGPTGLFGAPLEAYLPFFDPDYDAAAALDLDYPDTIVATTSAGAASMPVSAGGGNKPNIRNEVQSRPVQQQPSDTSRARAPISAAEAITHVVGDALKSMTDRPRAVIPPPSPDSIAVGPYVTTDSYVGKKSSSTSKPTGLKKASLRAIDLREKAELIYADFMKELIGTCI